MTGRLCIVGCDLGASKLHLASGSGPGLPRLARIDADGDDWIDRSYDLGASLIPVLDALTEAHGRGNVVLLVESPAWSRGQNAHQLGGAHSQVIGQARAAGYPAGHIHLSKVKKLVTGKGNAGKPLVVSSLAARLGVTFQTDDEADGIAVWACGMEIAGLPHPLDTVPAHQKAALDGLALPGLPPASKRNP